MRTTYRLLTAIVLLTIAACNNTNKVNLHDTNAKDEIPPLGNLSFTFDKNLAPDSLLNQWDSTAYITFSPPIRGKFRWENANELVFSPAFELPPATSFTASFNKSLVRYFPKYSLGNCPDQKFYTPGLQLSGSSIAWNVNDGNAGSAFPQLDLLFNYKVAPEKIKDVLTITVDGEQKSFNLQNTSAGSRLSVSIMNVKMDDKDRQVKVKLAKGLVPVGGNNPTKEELEQTLLLVSPYRLSINNVEANHDGIQGEVKIYTSQAPTAENLQNFISFNPPVNFKTSVTGDGISITSESFDVAKSYDLVIKAGLKGKIGGTLQEEYNTSVGFGKLEPSLSFGSNKGLYLSAKGSKNIELRITSIASVKVVISKIYENNLVAVQNYGYSPNDDYYSGDYEEGEEVYDDYDAYSYYGGGSGDFGDVIYEKVIETKNLPRMGNSRLFKFNFEDKLKDFRGIYHIEVRSTKDYWRNVSKMVSVSDIGLMAKQTDDKVYVFANSLLTTAALSNVNVTVYGTNNQMVGTATTNNDGVAEVPLSQKNFKGFRPAIITAKCEGDFNYMAFNGTRVETSRFDVGGKRSNSTGMDAFIYCERDIYRPGEKMNFSVIMRDWKWNRPGEVPLKIKVLLPNGKELKTLKKTLNEEGSLETHIELSPAAITGSYSYEVYTSNDILLASKSVLVEEFMPDRIKVTATADKKTATPGTVVNLGINAVNFFGPPAANRNYEVEIQLKEKYFSPDKYSKYNFLLADRDAYYEKVLREGSTDENGNASESFTIPAEYSNRGLMQADFFTTVFDETGRPVNRKTSIDIYTQDVFYGIGYSDYYYHPLNQPVNFPLIALNKDEKPLNGVTGHVQVIKHDYKTVLSRSGEYFRYESQREDKTIVDKDITVNGESTQFSFIPRTPGNYELRIGKPGVTAYVRTEFYSYGNWGGTGSNFEVNTEGNIDIEPDKSAYQCGESARVLFKTPFNGKMLVAVESDNVIEYQYVNVENRSASVTFNLKEGFLPNAYITATLIKPHQETDMPLLVARGFQSIKVEDKNRRQQVEIFADKNVRSRTHQKVRVKAAPNSKITLAAVDEGILQVTGFTTPNPYDYFYSKRALAVNSFDLYPLLFPELKGSLSSTGGDGFDLSKRTNPMQNKRVKLVSYWSGITDANSSGEASFEFDIPQFSGQLRLMAVAYKGNTFGSGDMSMTVADPVVISTALPRFLSPKDTVIMPVTISNTTKNAGNATAVVKLTGPLKIAGSATQTLSIKPNSEGRAQFSIVADNKIDVGKITVEVSALGEKFLDETDITIRPAASLQKRTEAGVIAAGSTGKIDFDAAYFMPGSTDYQLVISKNPALEIADQIYNLVDYPYGCTEQTVSAAFPQLYFGDLSDLLKMDKNVKAVANYNVQEAIRKIKMRQLYNGAITLWDNEGSENWWATVYAAHFLQEAQKAGFEVDKSLLNNIYEYLVNRLKNKESIPYYYNGNQKKMIAPKEVAYSLYVLALAGRQQVSTMNYYKQNAGMLALDSRYLLSATYAIAGDKGKFKELLPGSFSGEIAVKETGGSFSSDVRDEAVALNAILEVDPQNPQVGVMAKHLSAEAKKRRYLSTQERAFTFLALGKIAREANKSNVTVSVKANGKQVAANDGSTLKLSAKQLGGTNVEVSVSGNGKLYYFWQAEGISKDGSFKEEDSYIRVHKRFYDRYGHPVTANSFKQNELVIVAITLENAYSNPIENIVITDMLPAGFEIENPRTREIPGMDWIKNESTPTHRDVRDDRINLFVDLGSQPQIYYYAVRAVSPGNYVMGPVMADAMYNGEYHSYNGAGVIRVTEK